MYPPEAHLNGSIGQWVLGTWRCFSLNSEASIQSSHGQWNSGKNPGDVLAPSGRESLYRSPAPAHDLRNMCVSPSQALSRALSLTSKEAWFSHSISLKTPIHSLLLHLLHNISAKQSLPCIRKQSALSEQHTESPCFGMSN